MRSSLDRILEPASVAVVGASQDPRKRGHQVMRAVAGGGFDGRLYPVNPRGGTLMERPMAASLSELPEAPDLVVVATPAPSVPGLLEEAAEEQAGGAVVLAGGFREAGDEGAVLEERLRAVSRESGLRVVGPNCSGLMNAGRGLDLIGMPEVPAGRIGLVSQSGNAVLALLNESMEAKGEGFSVCVGVGNEADLAFHEYLAYLGDHPGTDVIMVYAEGFGDGRAFVEAASRVTPRKPVVLLRGGRSAAGEDAARSHTGAVMTPHQTVRAALREAGVVEVTRSDELLPVARALVSVARSSRRGWDPPGEGDPKRESEAGVAILADGGGQATVAADTLSDLGVPLARLAKETRRRLREVLGPAASVDDPVDVAGACDQAPHRFGEAVEALVDDPNVAAVLMVGLFGGYHLRFAQELEDEEVRAAERMAELAEERGKPLVLHSIYSGRGQSPLLRIREAGVAVMDSLEVACRAVGAQWDAALRMSAAAPRVSSDLEVQASENGAPPEEGAQSRRQTARILEDVAADGRLRLLEPEVRELAESYGAPLSPMRYCQSEAEVRAAARAYRSERLCVKVVSDTVTHKSDAGGVVLGAKGSEGADRASRDIRESVTRYAVQRDMEASIRGFLVGPLATRPVVEMLVGMRRDASFGPVVTVGAGGTDVEVHRDAAVRLLPIGREAVLEMLDELRVAPLLRGHRGRAGVDREALADLVLAMAHCFLDHEQLAVLEANPVFARRNDAVVVDLRAALSKRPAAHPRATSSTTTPDGFHRGPSEDPSRPVEARAGP